MTITPFNLRYRGVELAYAEMDGEDGFRAAIISSLEDKWRVGALPVSSPARAKDLAVDMVDYDYLLQAERVCLERELTPTEFHTFTERVAREFRDKRKDSHGTES